MKGYATFLSISTTFVINSVHFDSCTFEGNNYAINANPGSAVVSNSSIINGISASNVGSYSGDVSFINCIIENNSGLLFNVGTATSLHNCLILNNTGQFAKGVGYDWGSSLFIDNSAISNNYGDLSATSNASFQILNTEIYLNGNLFKTGTNSSVLLSNCVIYENNSVVEITGEWIDEVLIEYCTIHDNNGYGINADSLTIGSISINNSTFTNNSLGAIATQDSALPISIECSNVFNNPSGDYIGLPDQTGLNGNISRDPLFCDPDNGDFQLASNSACAPANNSCNLLIGAHGVGCDSIIRTILVLPDGSGDAATIQAAIDMAYDGDTILLMDGTYTGDGNRDISLLGKEITIMSANGPESTIIDAQADDSNWHRAFTFISGESPLTKIAGIKMLNCFNMPGTAILCDSSSPSIENCIFENLYTAFGAIACYNYSQPEIVACQFRFNVNDDEGTAISIKNSYPIIANCGFVSNEGSRGGAISLLDNSIVNMTNCNFINNTAYNYGGAIVCENSAIDIDSCLFIDNSADMGGVIHSEHSFISIDASTFCFNDVLAYYSKGSAINTNICSLSITNSILAFNSDSNFINCVTDLDVLELSCNNIYGNEMGDWVGCIAPFQNLNNNISQDPLFCNSDIDDYGLSNHSPCLPENNDCGVLMGARGMGCFTTQVLTFGIHDEDSIHVLNHNPVFSWLSGHGRDFNQTRYEIAVGTDNDWQYAEMWNPAPFNSPDTSIVYAGITLTDGATYYARLRVGDDTLWTDWAETSFRMNSIPTIPVPEYPLDDSFTDLHPMLSIRTSIDAENDSLFYFFQVQDDSGAVITTSPQIPPLEDAATQWLCDVELTEDQHYWWRAKATDTFEESNWSELEPFYVNSVNTAPSVFQIDYPPDTSGQPLDTLFPTYHWSSSTDPDPLDTVEYSLVIALDSNFQFANTINDIDTTFYETQSALEPGEHYWWKVKAYDVNGGETWSENVRDFWTMLCGDANNDKNVNVSDAVHIINFVFISGTPPTPYDAGDVNCDEQVNVSDAVWIINYVFANGFNPCDTDGDGVPDC